MNATRDKEGLDLKLEKSKFLEEENEGLLKRVAELETIVQQQRGLLTHHNATKDYVELFKKIDENQKYGLILLDSEYKVVAMSENARRILDYKTEEDLKKVIGRAYTELLIAEEARLEFRNLVAKKKESEMIRQAAGIKKKNGITYIKSRIALYMKTGRDEPIGLLIKFRRA